MEQQTEQRTQPESGQGTARRYAGRTVIVTGASSGIGVGIARRFSAEGANVVLAARRQERLDALAAELGADRTLAVRTDVTVSEDLHAMAAAAAERFGGIDVLVSNAGAGFGKEFGEVTEDEWRSVVATNLDSCWFGAQAVLPWLRESDAASIVQIASASGLGGDRMLTAYNAAKGAVVNLTRGLAFDLGQDGIRVNAITPSLTLGPDHLEDPAAVALVERFDARRAIPGYSTPDDIGAAAAFLASADARFITGAILPVDGGITAGSGQPPLF